MRLLSQFEQARLYWYLRWSQGDLSQIVSGFASVLAAELNEKLIPPEPSASFNDVMHVHPTRVRSMEFWTAQEAAFDKVNDERVVRQALSRLARPEQEELILAFVIELLPTRRGFGPYGNLADRVDVAAYQHRKRKRRTTLTRYLDRLSARANGSDNEARFAAGRIHLECEARAVLISRKYIRALDGLNAD